MSDAGERVARLRREPPPLLAVEVAAVEERSPRLLRLTFVGEDLTSMDTPELASSVRLLVPSPGTDELVVPEWNGNEFLLPGGERPALRTFTPLHFDGDGGRLDLEIVRHPGGAVSSWAEGAAPGSPAAISGPGRGWDAPEGLERLLLFGDETAMPAITQLAEAMGHVEVSGVIEVERPDAVIDLPAAAAGLTFAVRVSGSAPGATLVDAVKALADIGPGDHVWAAGEAASMQAIRKHLFDDRGLPRSATTVRGYWKPAR